MRVIRRFLVRLVEVAEPVARLGLTLARLAHEVVRTMKEVGIL